MISYLKTMQRVLDEGQFRPDRTGVGRLSIFGASETYDLANNTVPMVTTRHIYRKPFLTELFGMIGGHSKVEKLGKGFWGRWSPDKEFLKKLILDELEANGEKEKLSPEQLANFEKIADVHPVLGTIGPMYGALWRQWPIVNGICDFSWVTSMDDIASDRRAQLSQDFDRALMLSNGNLKNTEEARNQFVGDAYVRSLDQLNKVFLSLKRNPFSSHHRVTAFNPALIGPHADPRENVLEGYGALSPCHPLFQFYVREENGHRTLDCMFYMGSSDVCLGRPYNIAFYGLLTILMAHCLDYKPGKLHFTSGDTHIYGNHIEKAKEQVKLTPLENNTTVTIPSDKKDLFKLTANDLVFSEYHHLDKIDYEANV